jgi:hypothetical protein
MMKQIRPGFYVDGLGGEYFYLTGMYASVSKRLLEKPALNTPAFVVDVLEELRRSLESIYCIELMD